MEFAYPLANKILGKTSAEHLSSLSGSFFDQQTGEEVQFTEVNHYGGDKQVGAEEYWEVQGNDGNTYFIGENGDVRDDEDAIVGQFQVFAATETTTLPANGYHIGTDGAFKQAGITAQFALPPTSEFPEGTRFELPGGIQQYMNWVFSYWNENGGIVPLNDVPVTITADDLQAVDAAIASADRSQVRAATQEAMKCPECGSHSFRAMHVDNDKNANLHCLNCGNDWKAELTENTGNKYSAGLQDFGDDWQFGGGEEDTPPECPMCGGPGVFMGSLGKLDHFRCRNCGANFNTQGGVGFAGYGPDSGYEHQGKESAEKHQPGTRIEVVHPSNKGQRGSILKHKGTDGGTSEETYDILLDNGEKAEGLRASDFKRIKSARSDEMFLESLPIMPREEEYGFHYADYDWAAWGDEGIHHHKHPLHKDVPNDGRYLETFPCPRCGSANIRKVSFQGDMPQMPAPEEDATQNMGGQFQCLNCGLNFAGPQNPADFYAARQAAPMPPPGTVPPVQPAQQQSPGLNQQTAPCPNCGSTSVTTTGTMTQTGAPWFRCNSCGTMYQGQTQTPTQTMGAASEPHVKIPIGLLDDVIGIGSGDKSRHSPDGSCPTCTAGPEAAHPLQLETDVEGSPHVNLCTNCGSLYTTDAHSEDPTKPADNMNLAKTAFRDHKGNPMTPGNWYVMRSLKYKVPDVIQILNLEENRIEASIEGDVYGTFPLHILAEDIDKEGYSFEPYIHEIPGLPEPTAAADPGERARQVIDQITEILSSGQGTEQEINALVKQYYAIHDGVQDKAEEMQQRQPVQQAPGNAFSSWRLARKNFSPSEQRELVEENIGGRARNFDKLDLSGTHYAINYSIESIDDPDFLFGI
jgi:transcription elongation factor Elf1